MKQWKGPVPKKPRIVVAMMDEEAYQLLFDQAEADLGVYLIYTVYPENKGKTIDTIIKEMVKSAMTGE